MILITIILHFIFNTTWIKPTNSFDQSRFEAQLLNVRERLEAAKASSSRGLASSTEPSGFSFSGTGSRIAKPLRGGGGGGDITTSNNNPTTPVLNGLQPPGINGAGSPGKRGSWFFDRR